MGSLMMIVCVMVAMAGLASRVQADYHVSVFQTYPSGPGSPPSSRTLVACPSNYYNCNCYQSRASAGRIYPMEPPLSDSFFILGLCDYRYLDHSRNADGTYSAYVAGRNGKAVATCVGADKGNVTLKCPIDGKLVGGSVYDYLICKGKPCGNH